MSKIDTLIAHFGVLDTLARQDSPIHRLDPRAKLAATLLFIVTVVSFDKYQLSALLPFSIFPIVLIVLGRIPAGYLIKRVLWLAPFAVLIGVFNPLLDRQTLMQLGPVEISGGWVSLGSIVIRFFLTALAAFTLVAATGFHAVCLALQKLGVPDIFVAQLLFLYRYAFVLADEAARMFRAWQLRAPSSKMMTLRTFSTLTGSLFLRTTDRAQRIYQAMCCRGFDGRIRITRQLRWTRADTLFLTASGLLFVLLRFTAPATLLGRLITGFFL